MSKKVGIVKKSKAGRKKLADKKVTINLYIYQSTIKQFGNIERIKNWIYNSIDSEIESLK